MSTKPCPDCAHTDHPGQYIGFAFERSVCRTCNGTLEVSDGARTYKVDQVKVRWLDMDLPNGIIGIDTGARESITSIVRGHIEDGAIVIDSVAFDHDSAVEEDDHHYTAEDAMADLARAESLMEPDR